MNVKSFEVGPVSTNCYILSNDSGEALIVDPGEGASMLADYIDGAGLKPLAILLTHGHFDHIMAVDALRDKYGIKVYASSREKELLEDPRKNSSDMIGKSFATTADVYFEDSDTLTFSDMECDVIATPGHTVGSVCFYFRGDGRLFSGDTLFCEGIGRTDLATGDHRAIVESLKKLVNTLPNETKVYPGHGMRTTIGHEKHNNMFLDGYDLFAE